MTVKSQSEAFSTEDHDTCFQVEDSSFWFIRRNILIDTMVKQNTPKGRFLDVGGGNGFVSLYLQNNNSSLSVTLVEPGSQGCDNAAKRGVKSVANTTIEKYSEFSEVDGIGLFDVIEHVENPVSLLKSCASKLHKDGKIYVTVPAYSFLWSYEDTCGGHLRRYTARQLEAEAEAAGLKVKYSFYFFAVLIPIIFLFRSVPSFFGVNRSETSQDHRPGILSKIVEKILEWEYRFILKAGLRLPFGASLFACLTKEDSGE